MTTTLAKCPFCGRTVAVHDAKLREHLPPGRWPGKKCPGSGTKASA